MTPEEAPQRSESDFIRAGSGVDDISFRGIFGVAYVRVGTLKLEACPASKEAKGYCDSARQEFRTRAFGTSGTTVPSIEAFINGASPCVRATLNCYLWICTKAVPKIQVKASWAHT